MFMYNWLKSTLISKPSVCYNSVTCVSVINDTLAICILSYQLQVWLFVCSCCRYIISIH